MVMNMHDSAHTARLQLPLENREKLWLFADTPKEEQLSDSFTIINVNFNVNQAITANYIMYRYLLT
jgi:hypothetical protein